MRSTAWVLGADKARTERVTARELTAPNTSPTCDGQPSVATHAAIAVESAREICAQLGWE
jgi:hypothetical protein